MTPAIKEMILQTLQLVFSKGLHVDKALAMVFKQNKGRHKEEVAEAIYDILRNWRFLWACRQQEPSTDEEALKTALRTWELLQKEQARWQVRRSLSGGSRKH